MKILDVRIDWMLRYGNAPSLTVVVDRIPRLDDFRFRAVPVGRGTFYHARNGDAVYFLMHDPRSTSGFGGSIWNLTMDDGSPVALKGPWSSSTGVYNGVAEPHCASVAYLSEDYPWGGGIAGYLTVDALNAALARLVHPEIQLHAVGCGSPGNDLSDEQNSLLSLCKGDPQTIVYRLRKDDRHCLLLRCERCDVEVTPVDDYARKRHAFGVQHAHAEAAA